MLPLIQTGATGSLPLPTTGVVLFDDFVGGPQICTGVVGTLGWTSNTSGSGSGINNVGNPVANTIGDVVLKRYHIGYRIRSNLFTSFL